MNWTLLRIGSSEVRPQQLTSPTILLYIIFIKSDKLCIGRMQISVFDCDIKWAILWLDVFQDRHYRTIFANVSYQMLCFFF